MRYGIFADIHSNLEALTVVLSALKDEHVAGYYCCGDVVGYGANPRECLAEVKRVGIVCAAGNHDWAVAEKIGTDNFNLHAQAGVVWTRQRLNEQEKDFLGNFDLVYRNKDFILVHGTLDCPKDFDYLESGSQAAQSFVVMDRSICFVGHTHIPGIFIKKNNKVSDLLKFDKVTVDPGCHYIVNVGSVGQPRDRNPKAAYCIFDSSEKTIEIKRIEYNVSVAKKKILDSGLPSELGARLVSGQ